MRIVCSLEKAFRYDFDNVDGNGDDFFTMMIVCSLGKAFIARRRRVIAASGSALHKLKEMQPSMMVMVILMIVMNISMILMAISMMLMVISMMLMAISMMVI